MRNTAINWAQSRKLWRWLFPFTSLHFWYYDTIHQHHTGQQQPNPPSFLIMAVLPNLKVTTRLLCSNVLHRPRMRSVLQGQGTFRPAVSHQTVFKNPPFLASPRTPKLWINRRESQKNVPLILIDIRFAAQGKIETRRKGMVAIKMHPGLHLESLPVCVSLATLDNIILASSYLVNPLIIVLMILVLTSSAVCQSDQEYRGLALQVGLPLSSISTSHFQPLTGFGKSKKSVWYRIQPVPVWCHFHHRWMWRTTQTPPQR